MAQVVHSTRTVVLPYRKQSGGSYRIRHFYESTAISTAVIRAGDVVQFDVNVSTANHRIVKSSTMANVPNVLSTAFLGVAAETSTSDGGTTGLDTNQRKIGVYLANPDTEFLWPTKLGGANHLSSLVGSRRAIGYDSTLGMFYCDAGNSTAGDASLVVTDVIDAGTTNGFVAAKFLSTACARLISAAF